MKTALEKFIGKEVDVWSESGQGETRDNGVLLSVDDHWVQVRKDGELLFFSIARIRLVKLRV